VAPVTVNSGAFEHAGAAVPAVDAVATCDAERKAWRLALVNRHASAPVRCGIAFGREAVSGPLWATVLTDDDVDAYNDIDHPERVIPRRVEMTVQDGAVTLPPHSLTLLELTRAPSAEPLLANGGFEEAGAPERPDGWQAMQWGEGVYQATWSDEHPHAGRRCALLRSETGADCAWTQHVEVEPHTLYRLSGWIRTRDVVPGTGRGAFLNVQEVQGPTTRVLVGGTDWTSVEMTFDSGSHQTVQINCLLGGWGRSSGAAWFDDVSLERVAPQP
jgi:hypothetical protein